MGWMGDLPRAKQVRGTETAVWFLIHTDLNLLSTPAAWTAVKQTQDRTTVALSQPTEGSHGRASQVPWEQSRGGVRGPKHRVQSSSQTLKAC